MSDFIRAIVVLSCLCCLFLLIFVQSASWLFWLTIAGVLIASFAGFVVSVKMDCHDPEKMRAWDLSMAVGGDLE